MKENLCISQITYLLDSRVHYVRKKFRIAAFADQKHWNVIKNGVVKVEKMSLKILLNGY